MASPEEPAATVEAGNTSPVSTLTPSTGASAAKVSESSTGSGGKENTENGAEPEAFSDVAEDTDGSGGAGTGSRKSRRIKSKQDEARNAAAEAAAELQAAAAQKRGIVDVSQSDGEVRSSLVSDASALHFPYRFGCQLHLCRKNEDSSAFLRWIACAFLFSLTR